MDILLMEPLTRNRSHKNCRAFSDKSSGTNLKSEKSNERRNKYIKLHELT